jgi:peptidoglycan/xylan/chitin deacetylase (PgdA/CDA1 family)
MLASRPVAAIASRFFGGGVPIFMLHRMADDDNTQIGGTCPGHLRRCLQYLRERDYRFTSLEELVLLLSRGETPPPGSVVFTMDDGYIDQACVAAPIFEEFNCPVTFFVITGMLDQDLWPWDTRVAWIAEKATVGLLRTTLNGRDYHLPLDTAAQRRNAKRVLHDALRAAPSDTVEAAVDQLARDAGVDLPGQPPAAYQPMTWEMARQLERRGVQFAPHSVTHHVLSRLDSASLQYEINESWKALDRELLRPVKVFCYPTGRESDYDQRAIDALRNHGFMGAVTTTPDVVIPANANRDRLYRLPRFSLPDSMEDFIQCCTWIENAKNRLQRKTPLSPGH